jgi:carbon-monoxide dehydrogenase small subunit
MLITARDLVLRFGNPGEARIREELAGNLCRCTGYAGIVRAIQNVGTSIGRAIESPPLHAPIADPPSLVIEERDLTAVRAVPSLSEMSGAVTVIGHTLIVGAPCDGVWMFFHDVPQVAACLPGANLSSYDSNTWEGAVRIKLGPIRTQMNGKGKYELMEDRKTGRLEGTGADTFLSSRVKGSLDFAVAPDGPNSTRLTLSLSYALQGALAQFSRSSFAKEFVRLTVEDFARNVTDRLAGRETTSQNLTSDFKVFSILRKLMTSWWRSHPD